MKTCEDSNCKIIAEFSKRALDSANESLRTSENSAKNLAFLQEEIDRISKRVEEVARRLKFMNLIRSAVRSVFISTKER